LERFEEALQVHVRAAPLVAEPDRRGRVNHDRVGWSLHMRGLSTLELGRLDEAKALLAQALEAKQRGTATGKVRTSSVVATQTLIARCALVRGELEEACAHAQQALDAFAAMEPAGVVDARRAGAALHMLGVARVRMGRPAEAMAAFEQAIAAKQQCDPGDVDGTSIGESLERLGDCLLEAQRVAEARARFTEAVEAMHRGDWWGRVDQRQVGTVLHGLGLCAMRERSWEEARRWLELAVDAKARADWGRADRSSLGESRYELGRALAAMSLKDEAIAAYVRALDDMGAGDVRGQVDGERVDAVARELASLRRRGVGSAIPLS
jgi:tetratricopeptide (TPR) repeat protein